MTNARKRAASSVDSENRSYPDDPKDMDEIFQCLDEYTTLSPPSSPPYPYRPEFDKSRYPLVNTDLKKDVLSVDQFNSSVLMGFTLLESVEERLRAAASESVGAKDDGIINTWEEIANDMFKASSEVLVANKIYEKLTNDKSNCIFRLGDRRAEVNAKWFSIKNLFQAYKKDKNL